MWCCWRRAAAPVEELQLSGAGLKHVPQSVPLAGRTLERLHLARNRLQELPPALFVCKELRVLDLADNELLELPAAVQALANLRKLDLARNALADLPPELNKLRQLRFLDLSANPLERLPECLCSLLQLEQLYLNDAGLDFLPANFGRLASLSILELRDNCLAMLPKSLARAADLSRLDIGQNEFAEFPPVVGDFHRAKELWIDCNSITEIPPCIGNLVQMIHFDAGENAISQVAQELTNCVQLVDVCLSSNAIVALPHNIGNLVNLVSLKLDSNRLDRLPESIGNLCNLEELILTTNYLQELPHTIGRLRKLQCLNVDQNYLRTLPKDIGGCISITVLSLRSNSLTRLPEEIGHLLQLKVLNLVRNSLKNLPHSLLNCEHLAALWLSENQSKPLIPMQSEIDQDTGRRVLTCILFPQIAASQEPTVRNQTSFESDNSACVRHISFVDVKTAAREALEKPGNLRRAPTPYPKELRALAKHVRSNQKDEDEPTMKNAVHIKAARVASTLRQRFANGAPDAQLRLEDVAREQTSGYEGSEENPYDKPVNIERNDSYHNIDQTLYSESADSAYGGYNERIDDKNQYRGSARVRRNSIEERVNDIICQSSHDLYVSSQRLLDMRVCPVEASYESYATAADCNITREIDQADQIYQKRQLTSDYNTEQIQHIPMQAPMVYSRPEEAMYESRNDNYYNHYSGRSPVNYGEFNHNAINSNSNSYAGSVHSNSLNPNDRVYDYLNDPELDRLHQNVYSMSPRYVSYSNQGSEYNANVTPDLRRPLEVAVDNSCVKISPPPYHIAATYSKQAQYFNGNN